MPASPSSTLIVHSTKPFNAEPPLDRLRRRFVTPSDDFYVRSHGNLPDIDPDTHRLSIEGGVEKPFRLSLADVKRGFEVHDVMAVMQCAGNRRAGLQQVLPTTGDPWAAGAIGNARWTGVRLADLLRAAGLSANGHHVAFEGADVAANESAPDAPFGVSIPIAKALSNDVLVAWAMNGEPLRREHGAPLRAVVPGYAGVRSAKWLTTIRVQAEPSQAFQQARDYLFDPGV